MFTLDRYLLLLVGIGVVAVLVLLMGSLYF